MTTTGLRLIPRSAFPTSEGGWFWVGNAVLDEYAPRIGPYGFFVYCYLSRCADERGQCWPSVNRIAETLGISPDTVSVYIRHLAQAGLVSVQRRHHRQGGLTSNLYTLTVPLGAVPVGGEAEGDSLPDREGYPAAAGEVHGFSRGGSLPDRDEQDPSNQTQPTRPRDQDPTEPDPAAAGGVPLVGGRRREDGERTTEDGSSQPSALSPQPSGEEPGLLELYRAALSEWKAASDAAARRPQPASAGPSGLEMHRAFVNQWMAAQAAALSPQPADEESPATKRQRALVNRWLAAQAAPSPQPAALPPHPSPQPDADVDHWKARLQAAGVESERALGEVAHTARWLESLGRVSEVEGILSQARLSKLGGGWIVARLREAGTASIHAPRPVGWHSPLRPNPRPPTDADEFEQIRRDYGGYLKYGPQS